MSRRLVACLLLCAHGASSLHAPAPGGTVAAQRAAIVKMMGRAEKRAAAKRAKKGGGGGRGGGGAAPARAPPRADDKLPLYTVEARLREVPVFGLLSPGAGFVEQGSETIYYLDAREAERQAAANPGLRVSGLPLDQVYFDSTTRLKPSDDATFEAGLIPAARCLVPDVSTPLFCIDGFQTTDKETGKSSLPLFLSRADLLEFAVPVYGEREAAEKVLMTDLGVVVQNMLDGPAGLLRDGRFFADAKALTAMDKLQAIGQTSAGGAGALFPVAGGADALDNASPFPGAPALGNLKMPEMPKVGLPEMPGGGGKGGGGFKLPWQ